MTTVIPGTFTPEQIDTMIGCLDGDLFIPSQIGFSELRFGEITEDDTCWFELNKDGFEETDQASTIDATPEEIVARFLTAKDHWEEYDLQQDEQEETYE